ncbi:hypothetical protein AB205_0056610 [Aquarana catesbeiana]|uniref:Uncharacterized protein n=1 Tax=Aquarana catesbeiana TaxID=8400 RepID=A0A2G9Q115_AQUCT|nr:hypothetical protein AB205_0056610 [Aquarana catesbeiana]
MFHIPFYAIKYLCAKYTYFFYIGEKRLGGHPSSEETRDPHLMKKWRPTKANRMRRRRKEMWWN